MTSFTGYIQGITSGEKRTVDKQGKMVTVSAFDNIDDVIVFNEAGETTQETLTGKNLFDINLLDKTDITIDGNEATATALTFYNNFLNGIYPSPLPNNQYTLSFKAYTDGNDSTSGRGLVLGFRYSDNTINSTFVPNSVNSYESFSVTSDNNKTVVNVFIDFGSGSPNIWHIKDIQLEKGSTATEYEEYCGGIPSPNPDYPQDIKGIGLKQSDGTYSVFLDYDADEERFGRITASGLAYPLYEGDILDFVNSKVIRANGCFDMGSLNYTMYNASNGSAFVVTLPRGKIVPNTYDSGIKCTSYSEDTTVNNAYYIRDISCKYGGSYFGTTKFTAVDSNYNNASDFKTAMNGQFIVYPLATPTDEYITLSGDITDIGTAVVTAEGTLTIKYDKAKMAIRKYRNPPEWSEIGYESTPSEIITAFEYAKNLADTWTGVRSFYGVKDLYFFPDVDMTESRSYGGMFQNTNLMHVPPIVLGQETPTGNAGADSMFRATYVENVSLTAVNSAQKFELANTFFDCAFLKSVTLNLKANQINAMFYNCKKLESVNGEFDTSEVTNFAESFRECTTMQVAPALDTSSGTNFYRTFVGCLALTTAPNWNLQSATELGQMFGNCTGLRIVPLYYIPRATNLNGMFQGIGSNLEEGSRNNILLMCANATAYTGEKTLAKLGFNASMYSASSWQGLSKYADFVDAGWSIGYS